MTFEVTVISLRFDIDQEYHGEISFSAYLCVPLHLCGEFVRKICYRRGAEERRDTQRRFKLGHHPISSCHDYQGKALPSLKKPPVGLCPSYDINVCNG